MKFILSIVAVATMFVMISCGGGGDEGAAGGADWKNDKGVGPISSVQVGEIDQALVSQGSTIFTQKCTACHKIEEKYIGPALKGVANRRSPEWIMNMILNPDRMVKENAAAKKLFEEFMTPMSNQNLKQEEARALLEYLRSVSP